MNTPDDPRKPRSQQTNPQAPDRHEQERFMDRARELAADAGAAGAEPVGGVSGPFPVLTAESIREWPAPPEVIPFDREA
jgi:hypothetical protein